VKQLVDAELEEYCTAHSRAEPAGLEALAEETRAKSKAAQMMVGPLEGALLAMLVGITGARRVLEIGTFTGYSALSMASALPPGGRIVTCELSDFHADIAERHIAVSPWADRIEVRRGPALATIETLQGPFDLVFIDADKGGYRSYYDAVLPKLSERGVIAVDNVLWSGDVLRPPGDETNEDTAALVAFDDYVAADDRVDTVMLTIRDGVTLIRRR
jgi:predicted O-methyltransferase YrrM